MSSSVPRGRIWRSAGGVKGGVARGDLAKEIGVPLVHGLDVVGKNGKVAMLLLLHGEGAIRPPDGGVNIRPRVARVKVARICEVVEVRDKGRGLGPEIFPLDIGKKRVLLDV